MISGAYGESAGATVGCTLSIPSRIKSIDERACANVSSKTLRDSHLIFTSSCIAVIPFGDIVTLKSISQRKSSCA
jgi:hypothetical protein